ncbi:MAG: ATP-binding protein [Treponema sp.]|nr:ATP-binding protein [Treponema sp.]
MNIKEFYWDIKPFNVITGDMGSGKSLCIKLLYFFEEILVTSILYAQGFSRKLFENGNYSERLSRDFKDYFYLSDNNTDLKITYCFKCNGSNFTISVTWDDNQKKLLWHCDYLNSNLNKWIGYFTSPETPGIIRNARNQILDDIMHDFEEKLPISGIFVPASRAAMAVVGSNPPFKDRFLNDFLQYKDFLLSDSDISLCNEFANILKVKKIRINLTDEGDVVLEHNDGRAVPSLYSSSGQQELVYLLMLLEKLPKIDFSFTKMTSYFIEEPSAHLFPKEQKEVIECIADIFRKDKNICTRFFITTHSPYVLNVINNMLKKGSIIKRNNSRAQEIEKMFDFPHLFAEEVSASFINIDGTKKDMLDPNEEMIFADSIADISYQINEDTIELDKLNNKLISEQG